MATNVELEERVRALESQLRYVRRVSGASENTDTTFDQMWDYRLKIAGILASATDISPMEEQFLISVRRWMLANGLITKKQMAAVDRMIARIEAREEEQKLWEMEDSGYWPDPWGVDPW